MNPLIDKKCAQRGAVLATATQRCDRSDRDNWGEPVIADSSGHNHRWREDLCRKLISLQNKDGSWVNTADRWYEGNPMLVTAYSVLAMQTALE